MGHRWLGDGAASLLSPQSPVCLRILPCTTLLLGHFSPTFMRGMIPPLLVVGPKVQDALEIQLRPSSCTVTLLSTIHGPSLVAWHVRESARVVEAESGR